ETRAHRRLLLQPYARPLTMFSSRRELLSCLVDIIDAHLHVVKRGVLHRDISLNNVMIYLECTAAGATMRGLLVDFDYATLMNRPGRTISPGDRTVSHGTIPFIAIGILMQFTNNAVAQIHTVAHDLESIVYVIIYILVLYNGPHDQLRTDKEFRDTPLLVWVNGDWNSRASSKRSQMAAPSMLLQAISPYFNPFQ
ncbi:hypothetical protein BV22DRAFT_979185, partial [Leucogyrophana mollusca]